MVTEAIILAGGFGTRLKGLLDNIPKPMAPVNGRPFLDYILDHLAAEGIRHAVLSTGYMASTIENHYGGKYRSIKLTYSFEEEPLGTGGGILKASHLIASRNFLALNGDTLLKSELKNITAYHLHKNADITLALREVEDTGRYGKVVSDTSGRITGFMEKSAGGGSGEVNGGQYIISRRFLHSLQLPERFSFENELLATRYRDHSFFGYSSSGYFIDIGTPEDYEKAATDLR